MKCVYQYNTLVPLHILQRFNSLYTLCDLVINGLYKGRH